MAGRPREFDREQALVRARDVFWRRGYEGTSMGDLVEELGLAAPRLYAAFGSKEELFREAIAHYQAYEGGFADRALAEEPTARRAIERMFRDGVDALLTPGRPHGCMVVSSATNCSKNNDAVMEWLAGQRLARIANIERRLARAVADGELRPACDTGMLADYFATALSGIAVLARDGVPKERLLAMIPPILAVLDSQRIGQRAG